MLEGKDLIIATKPFAKEDRFKSWYYTISTTVFLVASFLVALYPFHLLIRITASLITALLLVRMFIIYHDFLHRTILKGSKLARLIFTVFGLYTLNPPSIWKRSHDYHHKHNSKLYSSSFGSFPIVTRSKFLGLSRKEKINYLFIRHPLTIAAGYLFAFWWGMCILSLVRNPTKHWDSAVALIFHHGVGLAIILTAGWTSFWLAFMIPAIVSSAMGSYLFYAQHNFPGVVFNDQENWTYAEAAMRSSSYMKMNKLLRWFTGNIGYHHIHHMNALIPFYRLPEVHEAFEEFQNTSNTSLSPSDIIGCLQIKVWDPEANRMLKLSEISS